MSFTKNFIQKYLSKYYLSVLQKNENSNQFYSFDSEESLFKLTFQLTNLIYPHLVPLEQNFVNKFLQQNFVISYAQLQNIQSLKKDSDKFIINYFKKKIPYIESLMNQLLIRLLLTYFEYLKHAGDEYFIKNNLEEIGLIYLVIKTQLTFQDRLAQLALFVQFFYNCFMKKTLNFNFIIFLKKIKDKCSIFGNLEKYINNLLQNKIKQIDSQSNLDKSIKNQNQFQKIESKYQKKIFSQRQTFRRKKKIINKLKNNLYQYDKTPMKQKRNFQKGTPKTEKVVQKSKLSPLKQLSLMRKMQKDRYKPLNRTIYYSQTKKFMTKNENGDLFTENATSLSIFQQKTQNNRRTEKKIYHRYDDQSEVSLEGVLVPETPKNLLFKTNSFDNSKLLKHHTNSR